MTALCKILTLACNSLSHKALIALSRDFGIEAAPVAAGLQAAMLRTAHKTIGSSLALFRLLQEAAESSLPLNQFCSGKLSTGLWDSPPLAQNLFEAHHFLQYDHVTAKSLKNALRKWIARPTHSLQASFHSIITLSFDCHWLPLLARRLSILFPQVSLDAASAATCFKKMIC